MKQKVTTMLKSLFRKAGYAIVRIQTNDFRADNADKEGGAFQVEYMRHVFNGDTYFVPRYAAYRGAARAILSDSYYEPDTHETIRKVFANIPGNMVHAGTFFGDMLPSFSQSANRVYAFEPVLENYLLARLCLSENNLENVVLFNAALSEQTGTLRISTLDAEGEHYGGGSRVAEQGHICSALRIDDLNLQNLAIIQLDVERYEISALRGAETTITAQRPLIMIEDNGGVCADYLKGLGYELLLDLSGLACWCHEARRDDFKFLL